MNKASSSLRLFLSADLAGSTAFKQSSEIEEWQDFFREFYQQLPALVEKQWVSRNLGRPRLTTWKIIGDEIVFTMPLTSHSQVLPTITAFRAAVADYRRRVTETTKSRLDVKCAGWTAGFPVGNMLVEPLGDLPEDYIGPGMDIGFRLVKAATPRKMLLSVELAWLLTLDDTNLSFFMDGGLELKGVARGNTYPCIWLDNFHDTTKRLSAADQLALEEEEVRRSEPKACEPQRLHKFCQQWLEHMGLPFVLPFISTDPRIAEPPKPYSGWLEKVTEKDVQGVKKAAEPKPSKTTATMDQIVSSLGESLTSTPKRRKNRRRH